MTGNYALVHVTRQAWGLTCSRCETRQVHANETARMKALAKHGDSCRGTVQTWEEGRPGIRMVDLDNTAACPRMGACESCGSDFDVTTTTAGTRAGVYCLRICERCARFENPPEHPDRYSARERVLAHCEHLTITAGEMAEALIGESLLRRHR